jgi:hypothetical protein
MFAVVVAERVILAKKTPEIDAAIVARKEQINLS